MHQSVADTYRTLLQGDDGDAATSQLTPAIRSAIGHEPAAYRLAVFGILHGSDSQMVGALVRWDRLSVNECKYRSVTACRASQRGIATGRTGLLNCSMCSPPGGRPTSNAWQQHVEIPAGVHGRQQHTTVWTHMSVLS